MCFALALLPFLFKLLDYFFEFLCPLTAYGLRTELADHLLDLAFATCLLLQIGYQLVLLLMYLCLILLFLLVELDLFDQ